MCFPLTVPHGILFPLLHDRTILGVASTPISHNRLDSSTSPVTYGFPSGIPAAPCIIASPIFFTLSVLSPFQLVPPLSPFQLFNPSTFQPFNPGPRLVPDRLGQPARKRLKP